MNTKAPEDKTEKVRILRIDENVREEKQDIVIIETPLTIFLNNEQLTTLLCMPVDMKYLATGFLCSEGIITDRNQIKNLAVDEAQGRAWIETVEEKNSVKIPRGKRIIGSGCGRGLTFSSALNTSRFRKIRSRVKVSPAQVLHLIKELQERSKLYKQTAGVHNAALCDNEQIIIFSEDVGRHNAVDKIFGKCLLQGIETRNKIIVTSGRVSSEILLKVEKMQIPVIVSRTAPTNLAVKFSRELDITLIGFARGKRMNVYAGRARITV